MLFSKIKFLQIVIIVSGTAGGSGFLINRAINQEIIKPAPDLPGVESGGDDNYGLVHFGFKTFGVYDYDSVVFACTLDQLILWNVMGRKCETWEDLEAYLPNKWSYVTLGDYVSTYQSKITDASKDEIQGQYNTEFWKPFYEDMSVDAWQHRTSAYKKCIARKDSKNKCTLSELRTYVRIDVAISKFKKWLFPETEEQKTERYKKFRTEYIEHSNKADEIVYT